MQESNKTKHFDKENVNVQLTKSYESSVQLKCMNQKNIITRNRSIKLSFINYLMKFR